MGYSIFYMNIRHSFSTWFIKKHNESNEKIAQLADQMGTSVKMLMNVYYDARVVGQLHMDDDDDFSELTQIEEIFKKDIRKSKKVDFDNLDSDDDRDNIIDDVNNAQLKKHPIPPKPDNLPKATKFLGGRNVPNLVQNTKKTLIH